MQFNSLYFLIFFLPIVLICYWLVNRKKGQKAANGLLLASSVVFYAFAGWQALLLLLLDLLANWGISWLLVRAYCLDKAGQKKFWLTAGIVFNAGTLLLFKYTDFFLSNLNALLGTDHPMANLILPLGISFTAFTQISWLVDASRGQTQTVTFPEYALFITWFPKLTQGPITFQKDFIPQEREQKIFDADRTRRGICMFVLGLSKKLFLADRFGQAADWGYQYIMLTNSWDILLVMLSYTLQIYFDFSGYSDMALGISLLFGYELPQNFDSPYKALSITEFWRRWHMSLTAFLREYLYFPLGGSRKGTGKTYRNIMIVYLVSGFWHGANWTYVLWGIGHGLIQCAERAVKQLCGRGSKRISGTPTTQKASGLRAGRLAIRAVRWVITFALINFLWLLFRAPSVAEYNRALYHLFCQPAPFSDLNLELVSLFSLPGLRFALEHLGIPYSDWGTYVASAAVYLTFSMVLILTAENNEKRQFRANGLTLATVLVLGCLCLLSLSNVSTFIYNNF